MIFEVMRPLYKVSTDKIKFPGLSPGEQSGPGGEALELGEEVRGKSTATLEGRRFSGNMDLTSLVARKSVSVNW